jgi:hypothetical protein
MAEKLRRFDFLGRGISYPFRFTQRTGGLYQGSSVSPSEQIQHVTESIYQILGTVIGSRVIRRDFGSRLRGIVFDPNDVSLDIEIDYIVRTALNTWEPRVVVGPIYTDRTEWKLGRLEINISITIIKTNVSTNVVFPYFLSEEQRKTFVTPGAPS